MFHALVDLFIGCVALVAIIGVPVGIATSIRTGNYFTGKHEPVKSTKPPVRDGAFIDGFATAAFVHELDKMFD